VNSFLPEIEAFTVQGTPADCSIIALECLIKDNVNLVVAGINEGANIGDDLFISGTVGAALQGYFRGIPSIAISVASQRNVDFNGAGIVLMSVANVLLQGKKMLIAQKPNFIDNRPPLLNINVPNLPAEKIQGISISRLSRRAYSDTVHEEEDARQRKWYWISHKTPIQEEEPGTDAWALRQHRASITPITPNLTGSDFMPWLQSLEHELETSIGEQALSLASKRINISS
jgi:5'-nucleotidase